MSLLGIDVGTGGTKAVLFSEAGAILDTQYAEYRVVSPQPGAAELDAVKVWSTVKALIARASSSAGADPIRAISAASLGEAMVPVSTDRRIIGPSILAVDARGEEYLPRLRAALSDERLFALNGNTLGNIFGLTKLMWIRDHWPAIYRDTRHFLNWSGLVAFLLGGAPAVDYSLANRSLLFDINECRWSDELLNIADLDADRLPPPVAPGALLGTVDSRVASELGLPAGVAICAGAHDQCANALGCGVIDPGTALLGMGTYLCAMPVYRGIPSPQRLRELGLNIEHHAAPGRFVSFVYNMSGAIVRWFRDTFAAVEHWQAQESGGDVYDRLFAEMPEAPSGVSVLPHWSPMGPPDFISNSSGVVTGLTLGTSRGEILKAILQGSLFSLKECLERLPEAGVGIDGFRAAGGGSKSDAWVQLCADILERPLARPRVTEAGALGAAILAGVGTGRFASVEQGCAAMVHIDRIFQPVHERIPAYREQYERYRRLWPLLRGFLTDPAARGRGTPTT